MRVLGHSSHQSPTPEQVHLSGYASIVGRAKGILCFCYGYARNGNWEGKSLWDAGKHVLTEIAEPLVAPRRIETDSQVVAVEGSGTAATRNPALTVAPPKKRKSEKSSLGGPLNAALQRIVPVPVLGCWHLWHALCYNAVR